jgi:hypothetical protein
MRRVLFLLPALLLLCGAVQAYIVVIDAPRDLQAGAPLLVTGNTTFPVGTQFEIILYKTQFTTPEEIGRRVIVVDTTKSFDASFATTSLSPGQYKVELEFFEGNAEKLGSGSTTTVIVNLVDRSDEIFLTAPANQTLPGALLIEGYVPGFGVGTLTVKVSGPEGFSLPDQYIKTTTELGRDDGIFSRKVNVTQPGNYYVSFYDQKGMITQIKYNVAGSPEPTTSLPTPDQTVEVSPEPTGSSSLPFPLAGLVGAMTVLVIFARLKKGP